MQTAPSAITGFTAPASGGKPPTKNEDQRNGSAGFATTLRSAIVPEEDTPQTPAQQPSEPGQPTGSESKEATVAGDARQNRPDRAAFSEQTLARALKPITKTASTDPATPLTQSLAIDADNPENVEETIAKPSGGTAPQLTQGLPAHSAEIDSPQTEEKSDSENPALTREKSAVDVEVKDAEAKDAEANDAGAKDAGAVAKSAVEPSDVPRRDRQTTLLQGQSHADGDAGTGTGSGNKTDAGDSPLLPKRLAQSPDNEKAVTPNTSAPGTEVTGAPPVQDSPSVSTSQKSGNLPAENLTPVAALPANGAATSEAKTAGAPASTAVDQSASSNVAQNEPARTKRAPTQAQPAVAAQTPDRQAASKGKTSTVAASTQQKTFEASLANSSSSRSAQSQSNTSAKSLPASHHKSTSAARPKHSAGELPGAKGKPDSVTSAKAESLTLKQSATSTAGIPDAGVDRIALTGAGSATRPSMANADLSASTALLPDIDAPLDPANVSDAFQGQLGERLVMAVRNDMSRAEIRINPNELGPITIELNIDGNTAAISFGAENNSTRNALQDSLPSLRDQLAREGLTLGEASVGEQQNRSSDQRERDQQLRQWTELSSNSAELGDEQALPDGYRPPPPARGLVDLFA